MSDLVSGSKATYLSTRPHKMVFVDEAKGHGALGGKKKVDHGFAKKKISSIKQ
jgi:hypothetical protein